MTASSPSSPAQHNGAPPLNTNSLSRSTARHHSHISNQSSYNPQNQHNSTQTFQQVKQTQASLARQSHVHQQLQAAINSNNNNNNNNSNNNNNININSPNNSGSSSNSHTVGQSNQQQQSHHAVQSSVNGGQSSQQHQQQQPTKPAATFVDCLIRRFKNCFNEDFCTVPMFVVGNLSPGIDGTHLILPPCVSLASQGINRFSSPKNLRLMNSIRESCRSIEELDLGGNKLTDLIEVYKILQLTPNLRFLNLSENDLSRTAPVAMATSSYPSSSTGQSTPMPFSSNNYHHLGSSPPANASGSCTRSYLAPLNQNSQLGGRRHSTLGQHSTTRTGGSSSSGAASVKKGSIQASSGASRVAEARRLAAANALAQSKKTSSSVASKLASASSTSNAGGRATSGARTSVQQSRLQAGQTSRRGQTSPTPSTMHLARSLSSLSAKDIRCSVRACLGRADPRQSSASSASARRNSTAKLAGSSARSATDRQKEQSPEEKSSFKIPTSSSSHQMLYVEPTIVETDDIDMSSEQQMSPNSVGGQGSTSGVVTNTTSQSCNNSNQQQKVTAQQAKTYNTTIQQPIFNLSVGGTTGTGTATATSTGSQVSSYSNNGNNTSFRRTFESIKALALNNTGCQWRVVCSILSRMPNLEELHLSLNNYEKIDLEPNEFKHYKLKRMYLCNNPKLTNWEELDKLLLTFPSLEALSIANCNISQIPDNLDRAREWRKLCGLNINGWPIKEWPVVERLNQLPSLIDLKCRNLEVLSTIDEPRHHLIARLPKLQRLNGSEIEEREEAEKAFVRFFMANSHLERPDRFHELMKIYGEISTVNVNVDLSPPSQALVRVIYLDRTYYRKENNDDIMMSEDFLLKLMDNAESGSNNVTQQQKSDTTETTADDGKSSAASKENTMEIGIEIDGAKTPVVRLFKDEGQEIVELTVDLRQSVRKFKSNLAQLFGLDGHNLILYYIDHEMVGLMGPELLKHNQKKLWNFNVQNGDQFIVEEQ